MLYQNYNDYDEINIGIVPKVYFVLISFRFVQSNMNRPTAPTACMQIQRSRWFITINNYDNLTELREVLENPDFNIKRAVLGLERSPSTNTPHVHGYFEMDRSFRGSYMKRLFPRANIMIPKQDSRNCYRYCIKDGVFIVHGDWTKEASFIMEMKRYAKVNSTGTIVKALMNPKHAMQVKMTMVYARHKDYYDERVKECEELVKQHKFFTLYENKKLYAWQHDVMRRIFQQGDRVITWVVDYEGNKGKTFFCNFLESVYNFQVFDGHLCPNEFAQLFNDKCAGLCFDVCRDGMKNFNYTTLEAIKDGNIISSKYRGIRMRFLSKKVVVMSNSRPNLTMLSEDRWEELIIGRDLPWVNTEEPTFDPKLEFPVSRPQSLPDMTEEFHLSSYLMNRGYFDNLPKNSAVHPADDPYLFLPSNSEPMPVPHPTRVQDSATPNVALQPTDQREIQSLAAPTQGLKALAFLFSLMH